MEPQPGGRQPDEATMQKVEAAMDRAAARQAVEEERQALREEIHVYSRRVARGGDGPLAMLGSFNASLMRTLVNVSEVVEEASEGLKNPPHEDSITNPKSYLATPQTRLKELLPLLNIHIRMLHLVMRLCQLDERFAAPPAASRKVPRGWPGENPRRPAPPAPSVPSAEHGDSPAGIVASVLAQAGQPKSFSSPSDGSGSEAADALDELFTPKRVQKMVDQLRRSGVLPDPSQQKRQRRQE